MKRLSKISAIFYFVTLYMEMIYRQTQGDINFRTTFLYFHKPLKHLPDTCRKRQSPTSLAKAGDSWRETWGRRARPAATPGERPGGGAQRLRRWISESPCKLEEAREPRKIRGEISPPRKSSAAKLHFLSAIWFLTALALK